MDCDFEFVTKSNYTELHKGKPVKFANIAGSRHNRMEERLKQRRSSRYDNFVNNRVIIDDGIPLSPHAELQSPTPPPKVKISLNIKIQQRKKELQLWLAEKKKRKADLVKSKVKPFVVPVVHSTLSYNPPSPVTKQGKLKKYVAVSDRVTRSRRDDNGPSMLNIAKPVVAKPKILKNTKATVPAKPSVISVKSFAPQNAKFCPPKMNSFPPYHPSLVDRTRAFTGKAKQPKSTEKLKPLNGHSGRVLRNRQARTSPSEPETENQNKRGRKALNGADNKSADRSRKSLRSEEVPVVVLHRWNDGKSGEMKTDVRHSTPAKPSGVPKSESLSEEKLKTPPTQTAMDHTLSAISPFVTMSRGKAKALRETKSKMDDGMLADDVCDEKSTQDFRNQLDMEIDRLRHTSKEWDDYSKANDAIIPENYKGLIFQAVCQTNLLISNKFEQFRGLIDRCDNQQNVDGEGAVTLQDLQGFWDMVFLQVDDIEIRFKKLMESRANDWAQKEVPTVNSKRPVVNNAKKRKVPKNTGPAPIRAMIDAARKAAAHNKSLPPEEARLMTPMKAFNIQLLKAHTPARNTDTRNSLTPARNTSMLKDVLSEARGLSVIKSTPTSMAILRASYISKCVTGNKQIDGEFTPEAVSPVNLSATPGRSILKIPSTAAESVRRMDGKKLLKVVLFTSEDASAVPATDSIEDGISPLARDSDIPLITDRLEVITMDTPQEMTASRRGRRKLTKQKAVVHESVENQEPGTEKPDGFPDILASPPQRITRNMRRRTLSILQNDSMTASIESSADVVMTPRTPRRRRKAKKTPFRKQSTGDLIDFSTPNRGISRC